MTKENLSRLIEEMKSKGLNVDDLLKSYSNTYGEEYKSPAKPKTKKNK